MVVKEPPGAGRGVYVGPELVMGREGVEKLELLEVRGAVGVTERWREEEEPATTTGEWTGVLGLWKLGLPECPDQLPWASPGWGVPWELLWPS